VAVVTVERNASISCGYCAEVDLRVG